MKIEQKTQELISELLEKLDIDADVEVTKQDGEEQGLDIVINPNDETGLLIGSHGSTLNAIQSFLNIALKQETGEWWRVNLDIGDWKEKHNNQLEELAIQAAMRARESKEPQHLYNLSAAQRRVVHMALSKQKGIETESVGEGAARYLIVRASK